MAYEAVTFHDHTFFFYFFDGHVVGLFRRCRCRCRCRRRRVRLHMTWLLLNLVATMLSRWRRSEDDFDGGRCLGSSAHWYLVFHLPGLAVAYSISYTFSRSIRGQVLRALSFLINKKSCTKIVMVASSLFWREGEQGWRVDGVALAVLVVARGSSTLRNRSLAGAWTWTFGFVGPHTNHKPKCNKSYR